MADDRLLPVASVVEEQHERGAMMRRIQHFAITLGLVGSMIIGGATMVSAAPNPSGTGQPAVECGEDGNGAGPAGFSTFGFAKAEEVYAGSEGSASAGHANSSHAVSQYDVACFQLTANQH